MTLLQHDIEGQSEPHHVALMSYHIFDFIGSDQYIMHLDDALSQPNRGEFMKQW